MKDWIYVNGAKIERAYLDENIREARGLDWSASSSNLLGNHAHCIVCGQAIEPMSNQTIYQAGEVFLDAYCYERFVAQ